jgi:hypothetical protein
MKEECHKCCDAWSHISKPTKGCLKETGVLRATIEKNIHEAIPECCSPWVTCYCVTEKIAFAVLYMPLLWPLICTMGVVSCIFRLCKCHCGGDSLFSLMECFLTFSSNAVDTFWDVTYWRAIKKEKEEKTQKKEVQEE